MSASFEAALLALGAYPFFWLLSFSPSLKVQVYVARGLDTPASFQFDKQPSILRTPPAVWATIFGLLVAYSEARCSHSPSLRAPTASFIGAASIAMSGRFLFGPLAESHKRVLQAPNGFVRPFRWRVLDIATSTVVNSSTRAAVHGLAFFAAAILVRVVTWFGAEIRTSGLVIPGFIVVPCAILFLGRLAKLMVNTKSPQFVVAQLLYNRKLWNAPQRIGIVLSCTAAWVLVYSALEELLRRCGAVPNALPSLSTLVAGLLFIPAFHFVAGVFDTLIAAPAD